MSRKVSCKLIPLTLPLQQPQLTQHSGWVVGFVSPYMINPDAGALGGKVGFVFAGLGVPLCILFYFLMPETKGLSFEEACSVLQQ